MSKEATASRRPATLVRAAAGTYAAQLAANGFSLMSVLIVARELGPTGRGQVAFLIAVSTLTSSLASMSVEEANANLGGARPEVRPTLVTNSFLLALVLGAAAALIVGGLVQIAPAVGGHADSALLWLVLATLPIGILQLYLKFLLQSDYRFLITNVAWVLSPGATAVLNGLLVVLGILTVRSAIIVWVATGALATLVLVVAVARAYGFGRPDPALAKECVWFGFKAHFGRFMALGNARADQWMLGAIAGPHELGLYSIARTWAEFLFYVPGTIQMLQRPDLVRSTRSYAAELASKMFRRAVVLSAGAGLAMLVAAPFLCVTVFGPKFGGSVPMLRVLSFAAIGIVAIELLSNALIAQRMPLLASGADGSALVMTIGLNVLLIPPLAGMGAAIATTVAYTLGGVAITTIFLWALKGRARDLVPGAADFAWFWRKARAELAVLRRRPAEL